MAEHSKHSNSQTATAPTAVATDPAPAAPVAQAATVPDERYRKVTLDAAGSTFAYGDASKDGVTVNRIDFIRASWTGTKQTRGSIAKELTRLTGKKVAYQIVFSATKGVAGGPPAGTATAAAQPTA